jgi:hypothetical protein
LDLGDIDHLFYHKALKKAKEVEARDYVENLDGSELSFRSLNLLSCLRVDGV